MRNFFSFNGWSDREHRLMRRKIESGAERNRQYNERAEIVIRERETKRANLNAMRESRLSPYGRFDRNDGRNGMRTCARRAGINARINHGYQPYRSERTYPDGKERTRYERKAGSGLYKERYDAKNGKWVRTELLQPYEAVKAHGEARTRAYERKIAQQKARHERSLMFANMYDRNHTLPPRERARVAKLDTDDWELQREGLVRFPADLADENPMRYSHGEKLEMYQKSREMAATEFVPRKPGESDIFNIAPEKVADEGFDAWHKTLFEKAQAIKPSPLTYEQYRAATKLQNEGRLSDAIYDKNGNGVLMEYTSGGRGNVWIVDKQTGKQAYISNVPLHLARKYAEDGTLIQKIETQLAYREKKKNPKKTETSVKQEQEIRPEFQKKMEQYKEMKKEGLNPEKRDDQQQENLTSAELLPNESLKKEEDLSPEEKMKKDILENVDMSKATVKKNPIDYLPPEQQAYANTHAHELWPDRYEKPTWINTEREKTSDMRFAEMVGAVTGISKARRPSADWAREQRGSVEQLENSLQWVNDNSEGLKKFLTYLLKKEQQESGREATPWRMKEEPYVRGPNEETLVLSDDISKLDGFNLHFVGGNFEPEMTVKVRKDPEGKWRVSPEWPEKASGYDQIS